jgi:hypothetical protein
MDNQWIFFSELKNRTVYMNDTSNSGSIEDVVLDMSSGQLLFYTIKSGGFLGVGADKLALPPAALEMRGEQPRLLVDQEEVRTAPGTDEWPEQYDTQFINTLYRHYGYKPAYPL